MEANTIQSLDSYLAGRKQLIAGREVLFSAARAYMRPEQRPDANRLGDTLAASPAWDIADDDWIVNAVRGYLVIMPNAAKQRPFRISVLQQGNDLHIGVLLPMGVTGSQRALLGSLFSDTAPLQLEMLTGDITLNWVYPAEQLYTNAQAMEDAVFRINALFEATLHALSAN